MKKNNIGKYSYKLEWSEEDELYLATCQEFPFLMAHGNTPVEALKEIVFVVAKTVEWMQEDGEPIPEPLSIKRYKMRFAKIRKVSSKQLVMA